MNIVMIETWLYNDSYPSGSAHTEVGLIDCGVNADQKENANGEVESQNEKTRDLLAHKVFQSAPTRELSHHRRNTRRIS